VTSGGSPRRIEVPVNMPEGMSYQGVFGKGGGIGVAARQFAPPPPPPPPVLGTVNQTVTVQAGVAGGLPGGVVGSPVSTQQKVDPALAELLKQPHNTARVQVQILLRDGSPATLERIGQLGVEVIRPAGRDLQLTAWIAIEKLVELSQLEAVRYVVLRKAA
jgi:Ca-activated chloride channel homolog